MTTVKLVVIFLFALAFPVLVLLSLSNEPVERSVEWELAVVNAGTQLSPDHPSVAEFRQLLNRLEQKSSNSRREIADICIYAHLWFKERGSLESLLEFTQKVDRAIPGELQTEIDLEKLVWGMMS